MLPGAMKCLAVAFAGACSVLSACVMHKDTTFAPPPLPAETTSATRIVVSSGVVTLSCDGTGTVPGSQGAGESTPDAGIAPDLLPDLATPDLSGVGSTCHPLLQDCQNKALVCYPGATGTGFCTPPTGSGAETAKCTESSDCASGYYCGNGRAASNICLLLCDVENPGCVKSSPCVEVPGFKDNTGYCLE
jgi:hypothetical protein